MVPVGWRQFHRGLWLRDGFWLLATSILIGSLYLSTLSVNHSEAEDSLWYLRFISRGTLEEQFHPNHLLYNGVNRLLLAGWWLLGYEGDVELPPKLLNIGGALAILGLLADLGRRIGLARRTRLFCLLLTAFSYGFWWYSVEIETYILPLVFILLSLQRFLVIQAGYIQAGFVRGWQHIAMGAFSALAILLHQQHVLIAPVILIGYLALWRRCHETHVRQQIVRGLVSWGAVCGGLVVAAYLFVAIFVLRRTSLPAIVGWLTAGGELGGYGYGLAIGALKAALGLGRAFVGAHHLFALPFVPALIQQLVPNYELTKFVFLAQGFSRGQAWVLAGATLLLVGLAAGLMRLLIWGKSQQRNDAQTADPARDFLTRLLVAYGVIYGLFNLWYLPDSLEVWIALVPMLALSAAIRLDRLRDRRSMRLVAGGTLICLLVVNLWGSVLPQTDRERDYWYQFSAGLIGVAQPGDLVISGAGYIADGYVAFYSGARVFSTLNADEDLRQQVASAIRRYRPQRVLVSSTVVASPLQGTGRAGSGHPVAVHFFQSIRAQLTVLHADAWQTVYVYEPQ